VTPSDVIAWGLIHMESCELPGMYLTARSRNTNLLLNVPPDRSGRIPDKFTRPLLRLRKNLDALGMRE
jgi:alpha-L-fucosidase